MKTGIRDLGFGIRKSTPRDVYARAIPCRSAPCARTDLPQILKQLAQRVSSYSSSNPKSRIPNPRSEGAQ